MVHICSKLAAASQELNASIEADRIGEQSHAIGKMAKSAKIRHYWQPIFRRLRRHCSTANPSQDRIFLAMAEQII